jgi:hypothetical protein
VQVAVDPFEARAQVVRVVEGHTAGVLRKAAQAVTRILAQNVFVVLEALRQRTAADLAAAENAAAALTHAVDLVANPCLLVVGAQADGVHRVDGHVGAIGRIGHAEEQVLHRGRQRQPLGKEHQALASRQPSHLLDDCEQAVRRRVAGLVALEGVKPANHVGLHLRQHRVARPGADVGAAGSGRGFGGGRPGTSRFRRLLERHGFLARILAVGRRGRALCHLVEARLEDVQVARERCVG